MSYCAISCLFLPFFHILLKTCYSFIVNGIKSYTVNSLILICLRPYYCMFIPKPKSRHAEWAGDGTRTCMFHLVPFLYRKEQMRGAANRMD